MPVAIFLGGDPVFPFAATAPLPDGLDEFLLAGYLRKKSIDLIKCETSELEVPANSDFVIEGYVDPREPLRTKVPLAITPGTTRCLNPIRSFTLQRSLIAKMRSIRLRSSVCRPWRIFTWAVPP